MTKLNDRQRKVLVGIYRDREHYARQERLQVVMRHSSISLTMDTYGHLLPGTQAEAADQLGAMVSLSEPSNDAHEIIVPMTGTDGPDGAPRVAQQLGRESVRSDAMECDKPRREAQTDKAHKPIVLGDLCAG